MSPPLKPDDVPHGDEPEHTYRLSKKSPIPPEGIQPPPPVKPVIARKLPSKPKSSPVWALMGFNALVFVTSVCVMTLELTASRLIGKHVGSSLYTWTSVIGVVLAGITLGNWLGGWLADRYDRGRSLAWMYLIGSVSCGSVLGLDQMVGTLPRPDSLSWPAWVVTVVAAIFLLPALALGTTSPLVASMALERSSRTGSTVGNVYAWGALGSIVGTFLTGFYLIDVFGTRSIIGLTAATLALLAILVAGSNRVFRTGVVLGWMQLLGWTVLVATAESPAMADAGRAIGRICSALQSEQEAAVTVNAWYEYGSLVGDKLHEVGLVMGVRDDSQGQYHDESNYFDIRISDTFHEGKPIKMLRLDKLIHSYYDPADPTSLHYDYEKVYAAVTKRVASPISSEPLSLSLSGLEEQKFDPKNLPEGVEFDPSIPSLKIQRPSSRVFTQLQAMAPDADYFQAIEQLYTETNKPLWGGFSSVNLAKLPEGVVIPSKFDSTLRHDETLEVLISYQPLSKDDRETLIAAAKSAPWYLAVERLRRESQRSSACFYGGGGFIFPRWFLQEFPGSTRIDVAELDPAVHEAVTIELGLTPELETRIHTTMGDARNFVDDQLRVKSRSPSGSVASSGYDFIYADAFNDFSIPWHLTTVEFLRKTHDLLSDRGVFQANIIDIYPRTEYPGTSVGFAEAEYSGRLPSGILKDAAPRDKWASANPFFKPLEVMELLSNRYRLRVARTLTSAEELKLLNVNWPEVKEPSEFEKTKGFVPAVNVESERDAWGKAIMQLGSRSRTRLAFKGKIPPQLGVTGKALEGWTSAAAPFEYVEAYRISDDQHVLGFRGFVSAEVEQQLISLDVANRDWADAVTTAAKQSRQPGAGRFMGRYVATAARIFPNIYLFSTSHQQPDSDRDTFVMVCSRQPINLNSLDDTGEWTGGPFAWMQMEPGQAEPSMNGQMRAVLAMAEGQILTDDFAPVDNLLAPVFMKQE